MGLSNAILSISIIFRLTLTEYFLSIFTHASCKPFGVITMYILISQVSGVYIVSYWAKDIMIVSRYDINTNLSIKLSGFIIMIVLRASTC